MIVLEIGDNFIIVMWQKYILLSGLRNSFSLMEVPFLAYRIFFVENCGFQFSFSIWV